MEASEYRGKTFIAIVNVTTVIALVVARWVEGKQTILIAVLSLVILMPLPRRDSI